MLSTAPVSILLLDDNRLSREAIALCLRDLGYRVSFREDRAGVPCSAVMVALSIKTGTLTIGPLRHCARWKMLSPIRCRY